MKLFFPCIFLEWLFFFFEFGHEIFFLLTLKGLRVQPNNLHGVTLFPCFITEEKDDRELKKDPSSNDFDLRETFPSETLIFLIGESNCTQRFKVWLLGVHRFETQMTKNTLFLKTHENTRCANHLNFNHKKL